MTKIPDICGHLQKLDQYVENVFVPALIDGLLLLPVKSGGMGIVLFADIAQTECKNSRNITESLTKLHLEQFPESRINRDELAKLKYNIKKEKMQFNTEILQSLIIELSTNKIRLNKTNQEKGATACLSTLPLKEEGYNLPKQEFWDLVKMRYGWPLSSSPNMCSYGAKYDLKHSLSCKKGGFVRFRHYLLRNITSNLIDQVFQDVPVEPPLQTLTDEIFDGYINECERRG